MSAWLTSSLTFTYTFTDNGLVDCSDYDDTLGEDFEKALEEELSEKEKEEER